MKLLTALLTAILLVMVSFPASADHRLNDPRRIYALQQQQLGYIHPSRRSHHHPPYYQQQYYHHQSRSNSTEKVVIGLVVGAIIGHAIGSSRQQPVQQNNYRTINGRLYQERVVYDDSCRCYTSVLVPVDD
jgi:hypothetical protein